MFDICCAFQGLIVGPRGGGKRFTAHRLAELLVRENADTVGNKSVADNVFKISFEDLTSNVDLLFDDVESSVAVMNRKGVRKSVVVVLEDVDAENASNLARFVLLTALRGSLRPLPHSGFHYPTNVPSYTLVP